MTAPADSDQISCDSVQSRSFAACDGELTNEEFVVIDSHLQLCSGCRTRLTGDATFLRAVRAAAVLDTAPASLRDRVAHLLHQNATENASA
jgi:predicted anti-sigma-YlaC factor YlaD